MPTKARKQQESSAFLKKRTKKPLPIKPHSIRRGRSQMTKSFLLLFFKKEVLSSFAYAERLSLNRATSAVISFQIEMLPLLWSESPLRFAEAIRTAAGASTPKLGT